MPLAGSAQTSSSGARVQSPKGHVETSAKHAARKCDSFHAHVNTLHSQFPSSEPEESMGNEERVKTATDWKRIGNEKFKAGNIQEARSYYREAIIFVEDHR